MRVCGAFCSPSFDQLPFLNCSSLLRWTCGVNSTTPPPYLPTFSKISIVRFFQDCGEQLVHLGFVFRPVPCERRTLLFEYLHEHRHFQIWVIILCWNNGGGEYAVRACISCVIHHKRKYHIERMHFVDRGHQIICASRQLCCI